MPTSSVVYAYVAAVTTSTQIKAEVQSQQAAAADANLALIDQKSFIAAYCKLYCASVVGAEQEAATYWNQLMGHYPAENGEHPDIHYLTKESCAKILRHRDRFISGIDYQHLPRGFFLVKNPQKNIVVIKNTKLKFIS